MIDWLLLIGRVLASLNLPAALEDLSGDAVPQSILEKSRAVVQQGGLQSIEQLIKDLPELLQRNREILDEVMHTFTICFYPFINHKIQTSEITSNNASVCAFI